MKDKKVKKLINQVLLSLRKEEKCEAEYMGDWSDYNLDVSTKFRKLVMDLVEFRDNISINISSSRIGITVDNVKNIKSSTHSFKSHKVSDDNYLEICIIKDKGFTIVHGYRLRTNYIDKDIYTELYDCISDRLRNINADNFNNIWENIVKESGILRDNNLDELLEISQ